MLDPLYQEERALRNVVLLRPIGLPDHAWEMNDSNSWHFIALDGNKLVGCVVLFPSASKKSSAQLMQMAIANNYQGKGIGKQMVLKLLQFAKEQGLKEITCHSRKNVNGFYEKLGFTVYGNDFEEVGIPHSHMRLVLN